MSFEGEMLEGLRDALDEMGVPVLWNGQTLRAVMGERVASNDLEATGFRPGVTFSLVFAKDDLGSVLPKVGEIIGDPISGGTYRITGVGESQGDAGLTLQCTSVNE